MSATLALHPVQRLRVVAVALVVAASTMVAASGAIKTVHIIVSSTSDSSAADAVQRAGGRVESSLPIANAVVADVPADNVAALSRIATVATDRKLVVRSASYSGAPGTAAPYEVGATDAWSTSAGRGIGVALVDTGVAPVPDLLDRVVAVADLTPEHRITDSFGHGTFMAGLIAGNGTASNGQYLGIAPESHLVSIKVATADGATTLSTVLEGLQIVDQSRERFNIRVMLLAMSSGSTLSPDSDPLTLALRKLWHHGIFVVVPAGNDGPGAGSVDSPGLDPTLMTSGAVDDMGTNSVSDDQVPSWTSRGPSQFGDAIPEVAAPGSHLVSLRAPGSTIDQQNPSARVGDMYFRGSGTSMAAAVTAGVGALILGANPSLSPDDVKAALIAGATPLAGADPNAIGAGVINAVAAGNAATSGDNANNGLRAHGAGNGNLSFDGRLWDGRVWDGRVWDGRVWDGRVWDSRVWDGRVWDSRVWDSRVWDSRVWDSRVWDGRLWESRVWDGRLWESRLWESRLWESRVWDSRLWE